MELNYKVFGDIGEDIIILHGLLGSLDNWQTIAKSLSDTYRVWIVDLRNHGRSPHSDQMSYELMAKDVFEWMNLHEIEHTHVIGHSMGGKVAMALALYYPEKVNHLIVVDIGPKPYVGDHLPILNAMLEIVPSRFENRGDIEKEFKEKIHSDKIVQLMMKNLGRDAQGFFWKPNIPVLFQVYRSLMDSVLVDSTFSGDTTFIKGAESDYIQVEELESFRKYFPHAEIRVVPNAGHWVHAEQPEYFLQTIRKILNQA